MYVWIRKTLINLFSLSILEEKKEKYLMNNGIGTARNKIYNKLKILRSQHHCLLIRYQVINLNNKFQGIRKFFNLKSK